MAISRKDFIKKLGLLGGTMAISSLTSAATLLEQSEKEGLTLEQEKFLLEIKDWLIRFSEMIEIQKAEPHNIENNKKLMLLAQEAENRKEKLTHYMTDGKFAASYLTVTENVRRSIS